MKGLLLKELYTLGKYGRVYLLLTAVFLGVSLFADQNMFFLFYPSFLIGLLPQSFIGMDEKNRWEAYCGALPYSKSEIVSSKYVLTLILQLVMILVTAILHGIKLSMAESFSWSVLFAVISALTLAGAATPALSLPILFKFGAEKGRIAIAVMLGVIFGGSFALSAIAGVTMEDSHLGAVMLLMPLIGLALYALSWYLSVYFYEKREIN